MPVCPGRVNGFLRKNEEKPFTLPGYTGLSIGDITDITVKVLRYVKTEKYGKA